MGNDDDTVRLIDNMPIVTCPGCLIPMAIRTPMPISGTELYRATFRCPQCGTDTERQFVPTRSASVQRNSI
jgi:hypothetical protein